MLGEELFDKSAECMKELALYTPSGAALVGQLTFIPAEITHLVVIICCPLVVIVVKSHMRHLRAAREATREKTGEVVTEQS